MDMPGAIAKALEDKSVVHAVIFTVFALGGQVFHAVKKWADGEADCMLGWLRTNPRRTVSAVLANISGIAAFVATGALDSMTVGAVIATAILQGFAADSALNKGERVKWTDEERKARSGG